MTKNIYKTALLKYRQIVNLAGFRNKKVFAIGFNKCGTTSLHALFHSLGRPSYHGEDWLTYRNPNLLQVFDCFSDGYPVKAFRELDKLYPEARFVLQVRDLESWLYSRLSHIEREKDGAELPYRDPRWDDTDFAVKHWIQERNNHHLDVLEYFKSRSKDILIVNFIRDPDAGTKLANYLGHRGTFHKPRENVSPTQGISEKHIEMVQRCAAEMGIRESELSNDIYCPSIAGAMMESNLPVDTALLD